MELDGKIAFLRERNHGDDSEIFTMRPDGTQVTQLTNNIEQEENLAWTPDGSKIVFLREVYVGKSLDTEPSFFRMNADGSDEARLRTPMTHRSTGIGLDVDWSPDGSKIAFVRDMLVSTNLARATIFLMNADGSDQTQLCPETKRWEDSPDWSPDGSKIAFVRTDDGGSQIYTVNADGTGLTQLTRDPAYTTDSPEWSPDGSKVLFSAYHKDVGEFGPDSGDNYDVFVMNADGSGVQNLTDKPEFNDTEPTWSPDGRDIAFVRGSLHGEAPRRSPDYRGADSEIWRMGADGSLPTRLTRNSVYDFDPVWQPIPSAARTSNAATAGGATVVGDSLAPSGGRSLLLPASTLLTGMGVLIYAVLRRFV